MVSMSDHASAMLVRTATMADIPVIVRIVNEAYAVEDFVEGERTDPEAIAEMMGKGEFFVAERDGEMRGSMYVEQRGARGYFGMLAVDPPRQGSGIGRKLIEAAEQHCRERGCKWMDIVVLTLRPELPPLYRRFGYRETRREPFKLSRPLKFGYACQGIVMSKEL